jgi:diphthamide synthase (EF-2-diphthine--ammonia ligase)
VGRVFDEKLLRDLPDGVDPCGENGEFHTFVYAGPIFEQPIAVRPGPVSERDGFAWADLVAEADSTEAQSA